MKKLPKLLCCFRYEYINQKFSIENVVALSFAASRVRSTPSKQTHGNTEMDTRAASFYGFGRVTNAQSSVAYESTNDVSIAGSVEVDSTADGTEENAANTIRNVDFILGSTEASAPSCGIGQNLESTMHTDDSKTTVEDPRMGSSEDSSSAGSTGQNLKNTMQCADSKTTAEDSTLGSTADSSPADGSGQNLKDAAPSADYKATVEDHRLISAETGSQPVSPDNEGTNRSLIFRTILFFI